MLLEGASVYTLQGHRSTLISSSDPAGLWYELSCRLGPSTDQFVSCGGLKNQSEMVHTRRPAAGPSRRKSALERGRVANINRQIAEELGVREQQISATVELLDGCATVPFVARSREEITG